MKHSAGSFPLALSAERFFHESEDPQGVSCGIEYCEVVRRGFPQVSLHEELHCHGEHGHAGKWIVSPHGGGDFVREDSRC